MPEVEDIEKEVYMYCPSCGAANNEGVKFCSNCNKELIVANTGSYGDNKTPGQNQQPVQFSKEAAPGYQPQGTGYQAPGSGYQAQGPGYPPQGSAYQAQGSGYPPQGPGYPPQGQGYPPQGPGYPPQGPGYPPQGPGPQGPGYQNQQPYYQSDAEKNKVIAIIAYFIFFIPLLAAKDSPFAKYHANQGFIIFVLSVGINIVFSIITGVLLFSLSFGLTALISGLSTLINLGILVLAILGIINAAKGEMKPVPIVGELFTVFK